MVHLINITRQHGDRILFRDASLQILPGDRAGLVGPNGAGKSTIFRLITGEEITDKGSVSCAKKTVIGHFSQDVGNMAGRTALAEVMAAAGNTVRLGEELRQLEAAMSEPMEDEALAVLVERYGDTMEEFEHLGGYDLESRAQAVLTGLGIGPDDYLRPVESFSGGWKMRIALAKILTINPDVLLLDEPTNHLDVESIVWLENWLAKDFKGSVLMTSHDRDFMNRIVSRTIEVANGAVTTYSGNYDFYLREREIRREQLLASHQRQQAMLAKEEDFIARFAARASHAAQVQSRVKKLDKIERIDLPAEQRVHRAAPERRRRCQLRRSCQGLAPCRRRREIGVQRGIRGYPAAGEDRSSRHKRRRQIDLFKGTGRPDQTQCRYSYNWCQRLSRLFQSACPGPPASGSHHLRNRAGHNARCNHRHDP